MPTFASARKGACAVGVLLVAGIATQCQQAAPDLSPPNLDYEIVARTTTAKNGTTIDVVRVRSEYLKPPTLVSRTLKANQVVSDITAEGWPIDGQGNPKVLLVLWLLPDEATEEGAFVYAPNASSRQFAALTSPASPKPKPKPQPSAKELARRRAGEQRRAAITAIKARCQRQMGSQGASLVKYCTDLDIAAYDALQRYPRKHKSILDRCKRTMMATGGWSLVKYCADEDIAAAKALEGY